MSGKKLSRNAPCWCGSGRKYKWCCLGRDESEVDSFFDRLAQHFADSAETGELVVVEDISIFDKHGRSVTMDEVLAGLEDDGWVLFGD